MSKLQTDAPPGSPRNAPLITHPPGPCRGWALGWEKTEHPGWAHTRTSGDARLTSTPPAVPFSLFSLPGRTQKLLLPRGEARRSRAAHQHAQAQLPYNTHAHALAREALPCCGGGLETNKPLVSVRVSSCWPASLPRPAPCLPAFSRPLPPLSLPCRRGHARPRGTGARACSPAPAPPMRGAR